ncbi:ArsR/SmtB family transcription factor [Herbihabitans rhizosphaerae]|nr:metalloregulator ArsR/SmtB family transcription factor [Herbihabitans rhizosphaerae]
MRTRGLAETAAVLAEPARAAMCLALLDGRAWTVGELATAAGVAPSTASEHVSTLDGAGFVESLKQGRHRYVRIADAQVAALIERLAEHTDHRPAPAGLRASIRAKHLTAARTCYDHLAGRLGVAVRAGMVDHGLVDLSSGISLTSQGKSVLAELDVPLPLAGRRPLLRDCLDWTERTEHLGGGVPAALLDRALAAGWVRRGDGRAITVTPAAREPFAALGVDIDAQR